MVDLGPQRADACADLKDIAGQRKPLSKPGEPGLRVRAVVVVQADASGELLSRAGVLADRVRCDRRGYPTITADPCRGDDELQGPWDCLMYTEPKPVQPEQHTNNRRSNVTFHLGLLVILDLLQ